jgi:putative ribosome biogenesis GTPase RsgA
MRASGHVVNKRGRKPMDRGEQLDMEEKTEKVLARKPADDVSKILGDTVFVMNRTFPWAILDGIQKKKVTFDRYYIQSGICFDRIDKMDCEDVANERRELCNRNGFRYVYSSPTMGPLKMQEYLEAQHVDNGTE